MELSPMDRRRAKRFNFYNGIECRIVATDGTWQRSCVMEDASDSGAKLMLNGSIDGQHLKQFILVLLTSGLAYRRCELAWVNGNEIGVNFLEDAKTPACPLARGEEPNPGVGARG